MNCEISIKSEDFLFADVDPSLINLFKGGSLDENEFFEKLKNGTNDDAVENIIKEVDENNKVEILVYDDTSETLAYIDTDDNFVLLNKDFCEKFDIRQIIKENIFDCKNESDIKTHLTDNINTISKTSKMLYGCAGNYFLFCITTALIDIITQYVSDGGNNYEELIKTCETFYNIKSLYSWVLDFRVF